MAQEIIDHNGVKVGVADMKRYWKEHPDPGFSEARNKATINRVIKHNEQVFKRLRAQLDDETRDRANAVAHFLKYKDRGGHQTVEGYFGRRELARLRGDELVAKLKRAYAPQEQQTEG